jgi:hypothetical protein
MIKAIRIVWSMPVKMKDRYGMMLLLAVFGALFCYREYHKFDYIPLIPITLSLVLIIMVWVFKKPAEFVVRVWLTITRIIGSISFSIILFILFYLVLTPFSVLSRMFGNQYLLLKPANTYWTKVNMKETNYKNQG